ncbi:class I fructose-bisphosphate aldolase [Larkinella bovis]|uniref:Class I fructose-bisphosphate aldolase n=1 Tax=Larkinella bovis TaxID=683041 RepID=A0ABW0I937_9BACT
MYQTAKVRFNRMFNESGRCLDVAIDHGIFNEYSFLDGLENVEQVIGQLVAAGPDAIQTNYGQSDILQRIPGKNKPALVMRVDMGNPYNAETHRVMFSALQNENEPLLEALRMDASCVVCNLLLLPNEPDLHRQSLRNLARIRSECDKYGIPLMIEPLVMAPNDKRGGYQVDGNKKLIVPLVRQAREIGADIIKADPTEHVEDYHEVVEAARCPVLVRGGGKESLESIFEKSYQFLQQGTKGLVYGRNIYQHPNPTQIVKAFMAMIHQNATPAEALAIYHQNEQSGQ